MEDVVSSEILEGLMKLRPAEKFVVVEELLRSLDAPDEDIDQVWANEAERRLEAYRNGNARGIPMEEVFRSIK